MSISVSGEDYGYFKGMRRFESVSRSRWFPDHFLSREQTVNSVLPLQQFYVGTSFIGGEDQGYIACP
jgi:hypothetical protein